MADKKVRMIAVFVLYTDSPDFWKGLGDYVKNNNPERADDVETFKVENFGIPMYKVDDNPILIEFEERDLPPKEG